MKLLKIILVFLLFTGCEEAFLVSGDNENPFSSEKTTDNLALKLDITSENIESLEDIEAEFTLLNISDETLTFGFPSACQHGYTVERNGTVIFDRRDNLVCAAVLTQLVLEPGQPKTYQIGRFGSNTDLDPGVYKLTAFLLEDHGVEISTFFEVE